MIVQSFVTETTTFHAWPVPWQPQRGDGPRLIKHQLQIEWKAALSQTVELCREATQKLLSWKSRCWWRHWFESRWLLSPLRTSWCETCQVQNGCSTAVDPSHLLTVRSWVWISLNLAECSAFFSYLSLSSQWCVLIKVRQGGLELLVYHINMVA